MNVPFVFRLPSAPRVKMALVGAMLGLGLAEAGWAQLSLNSVVVPAKVEPVTVSLRSTQAEIAMNFGTEEDARLGEVPSFVAPPPGGGDTAAATKAKPTTVRLGSEGFNRAADSFNVWKTDGAKEEDVTRKLGMGAATTNSVTAAPISWWAIMGIASLAIMVAMAIGYYENDHDDRKRRKSRRRRHRSTSS